MPNVESLTQDLKAGIVRIFVIDDDLDICNGLKDILQDAGYHVETANSGHDGYAHLGRQTFGILIVDYSLPDTNGIEIARKVRSQYPWMQTLLMTGHDHVEISERHKSAPLLGAFLRKPIDVQIILQVVEETLHRLCDHFQIPRFSAQPEVYPDPALKPVREDRQAPVLPVEPLAREAVPRWIRGLWAAPLLLGGFAMGWFSHNMRMQIINPQPAVLPSSVPHHRRKKMPPVDAATVASTTPAPLPTLLTKPSQVTTATPEAPRPRWSAQLDSDDPAIRIRAAKALLKSSPGHEKATATLLALIKDNDSTVRLAAIEATSVSGLATQPVVRALAETLHDSDPAVAYAAASALARVGEAAIPALPELIDIMLDSPPERDSVQKAAKSIVFRLGEQATPILLSRMDDDPDSRAEVIEALGTLGPTAKEAIPALTALENDPVVGIAVMKATAQIQPQGR